MPYSLPTLARRAGKRRNITLRPIIPTQAQVTDLATIYAPAWRIWADNIDRILAGYDPQPLPTADALTIDTADQVQTAINGVANEFLTILTARITPALQRWLISAERVHRSKWSAAIRAGVGVDLEMMLSAQPVEETLSAWMARNTALVKNISDQAQSRISDAVFRGYQQRTPVREMAKEITGYTGMGRDRALRVASDQSSKLSSALDKERQAEAGLSEYKYRHGGKLHARPWHKKRDGHIFTLRTDKEVDGSEQIEPGDGPGEPPFCSCRRQAYIRLLDEIE